MALKPLDLQERCSPLVLLSLLFLLSWLPRLVLAVAWNPHGPHPYDSLYEEMAANYAAGRGLTADQTFGRYGPIPLYSFRPPLFPWLWGLLYGPTGGSYRAMRVVQSLFGALACIVVYRMTSELFGRRPALLAWIGASLYPPLIWHSVHLMTEPLFILFHTAAFYFLLTMRRYPFMVGAYVTPWAPLYDDPRECDRAMLAGVCAGLATLARSVMIGMAPIMFVWILVHSRRFRRNFVIGCIFLAGWGVTMLPWWIRNYNVLGEPVLTTTDGGHGFYGGNNPVALSRPTGFGWPGDWEIMKGVRDELEMNRRFYHAGLQYWDSHPEAVTKLMWDRFKRLWRPFPHARYASVWEYGDESSLPPYSAWEIIVSAVYLLSFVVTLPIMAGGFWLAWRRVQLRRPEWTLDILMVVYTTVIHMVFQATIRYREPMWPVLFPIWGMAIADFMQWRKLARAPHEETQA